MTSTTPLTLAEWLELRNTDWRTALCINIATDGLDPFKDNLLAVGAQYPQDEPEYIYVGGGFPSDTTQYHGITLNHYKDNWVGPKRAWEILKEIVQDARFLVVNNKDFFDKWLLRQEPPLLALSDYPVFGLIDYAKYLDSGDRLYDGTGESIDDIVKVITTNVQSMRYSGGYSMDTLYSRITGKLPETEGVLFENKTKELTGLYCELLWA